MIHPHNFLHCKKKYSTMAGITFQFIKINLSHQIHYQCKKNIKKKRFNDAKNSLLIYT